MFLSVNDLVVRYGQLTALRGVGLEMDEGETLFITGPNGAGKSTLLKAIAGVVTPVAGTIMLAGNDITGEAPETIAQHGFSMVPEGRHVFGALTIDENLRLGMGISPDKRRAEEDLVAIYETFPALYERRNHPAGVLSGGQQQMLVIGRALMASPRLIAIDEPSLGLAPKIIDQVYDTLAQLRDQRGLTLLIVEQSTARAAMTGGRMVVIRSGEIVLQGDAQALAQGDALNNAYFGFESS